MTEDTGKSGRAARPLRADARRNLDALLAAAKAVFAAEGVDAPAKRIADLAGVGVGTLYRHFPQRSDLVKAVFQREVDACADVAPELSAAYGPGAALDRWLHRYTEFLATKRGLAAALHSGDPAFDALPGYFMGRLGPALASLLDAAAAHGEIGDGVSPEELLYAVGHLCLPVEGDGAGHSRRMVALLIDGLRFRADSSRSQRKSEMRSTASMSVARDPVEKDASAPTQPRKAPESSMICMSGLTCELPV